MLRIRYGLAILGMATCCVPADLAFAQTCAAPFAWHPGQSPGAVALTGTTCGHETSILTVCQDAMDAPGEAFIATIDVNDEATFTSIDATGGPGYSLTMWLVPEANGCGNFACTTSGDETADLLHVDIPPGRYYLIITGADFDPRGACGTFVLASDGNLPVSLQGFSVT